MLFWFFCKTYVCKHDFKRERKHIELKLTQKNWPIILLPFFYQRHPNMDIFQSKMKILNGGLLIGSTVWQKETMTLKKQPSACIRITLLFFSRMKIGRKHQKTMLSTGGPPLTPFLLHRFLFTNFVYNCVFWKKEKTHKPFTFWKWKHILKKNHILKMKAHSETHFWKWKHDLLS